MVSIEIAPRCAAHCPAPHDCDTLCRQSGEAGERDTPPRHSMTAAPLCGVR